MIRFLLTLLFFLTFAVLPKDLLSHSEVQIIEMTSNGFEPPSITLDKNSSLIFINKDKVVRWPASNVHPTHEIYPEFDPRKPIEVGKSWSFKPTKAGEWKYHDHLLPHMRGVIKVVAEEGSKENQTTRLPIFDDIKNTISDLFFKLKTFFSPLLPSKQIELPDKESFKKLSKTPQEDETRDIAQSLGASKAWEYIKEVFKNESGSSGNVHDLAHLSGSLLYKEKGFDGIGSCSQGFAFGCFHGFLDEAFKKDLAHLLDAQNACLKLGPENSGPAASCIHGIGHGVASFHSTADLKASLSSCRKLTSGREYCFDGVFMEFVRSAPDSFFKADDPLYPCNELEKDFGPTYSLACGRNQPPLLMGRFKKSFDNVVGICRNAPSKLFREACFDALGFSLASTIDVQQIIAGCQTIQMSEYVSRCAKAAAGELVFQEAPNWYEKSQAICNAFLESRETCLRHVDRLTKEYGRKVKINYNRKSENEDINIYIRAQLKKCYEVGGRDGCYKDAATLFYNQFGLATTLQTLKTNEEYPEVYARCHEVTHYLSRFEYDKLKNIAKVYAQCDSTCHGGCYHGTMEAYLKEKQLAQESVSDHFTKVCGKIEDYQNALEFNECLHGLGHAAMFVTDMELRQSLSLCDNISGLKERERCYTGVFMENSSSSTSNDHQSIYLKADDPNYPCNSLEEKYQAMCWQYQSSYFAIISNQDWTKVAAMCLQIPPQYQDRCVRTIGTNQVGFTPQLKVMKQDCDLMPNVHFQSVCVEGVISSFAYRFVGDFDRMIEFCSIANPENKEACFKQMGTAFMDWTTDKGLAKSNCSKIPDPQGVSWCTEAI